MRVLIVVSLVFCLFSCAVRVPNSKKYINILKKCEPLDSRLSVCVLYPKDFVAGNSVQQNSSLIVGDKIFETFRKYSDEVLVIKSNMTLEDGFDYAKSSDAAYLITSSIIKWEDRVTGNFLGRLDKGELIVSAYDVRTSELLQQSVIGGAGSSVTVNFIPMGTHGPEDCLTEGLASWVAILYGQNN